MNSHLDPTPRPAGPPPPEPAPAERARTLLERARTGMLATLSRRHPGHPFGSVMPYALDAAARPLFLISRLAMHTQNLEGDPRASLLALEVADAGDPLAVGRVTLMGTARRVPDDDVAQARAAYLAWHPNAANWVDFDDFAFWRLEVADVYWVGGFGAMGWIEERDYTGARPDPLADAAPDIIEHMNRDHADALVTYARVLAGLDADEAAMLAVDRLGFRLRLSSGGRLHATRIAFPREVRSAEEARVVLIEMLRECRARPPASS